MKIALKKWFQYVLPISILKIFLKMTSVKLSDYNNIYKYTSLYQVTQNYIYSLITKDLEFLTKTVSMLL